MAKAATELGFEQIQKAVARLEFKEKLKLLKELDQQTQDERWKALFARLEKRYKQNPISDEEITRIVEQVRKRRYERATQGRR